jgi:hypothetical protein
MASSGPLLLSQFPLKLVRLSCTRCMRKGLYAKAALVHKYGGDTPLPDIRNIIANCPNKDKLGACGVYFSDLKPQE